VQPTTRPIGFATITAAVNNFGHVESTAKSSRLKFSSCLRLTNRFEVSALQQCNDHNVVNDSNERQWSSGAHSARSRQNDGYVLLPYTFRRADRISDEHTVDETFPDCVVQNVATWEMVFAPPLMIDLVMAHNRFNHLGLVRNHSLHLLNLPEHLFNVVAAFVDSFVDLSRQPGSPHHWSISSKEISLVYRHSS
jgi:hypothetical protein